MSQGKIANELLEFWIRGQATSRILIPNCVQSSKTSGQAEVHKL